MRFVTQKTLKNYNTVVKGEPYIYPTPYEFYLGEFKHMEGM